MAVAAQVHCRDAADDLAFAHAVMLVEVDRRLLRPLLERGEGNEELLLGGIAGWLGKEAESGGQHKEQQRKPSHGSSRHGLVGRLPNVFDVINRFALHHTGTASSKTPFPMRGLSASLM